MIWLAVLIWNRHQFNSQSTGNHRTWDQIFGSIHTGGAGSYSGRSGRFPTNCPFCHLFNLVCINALLPICYHIETKSTVRVITISEYTLGNGKRANGWSATDQYPQTALLRLGF
eukprot:scaffold208_cov323-Pavlova_lutheri.AAC.14